MVGSESQKVSFYDALTYCNEKGGVLAEPTSSLIQSTLESLAHDANTFLWIGATDAASEGNFVWMSGAEFSYTNWKAPEPNNGSGNEHCVVLRGYGAAMGQWIDVNCNGWNAWILCMKGK